MAGTAHQNLAQAPQMAAPQQPHAAPSASIPRNHFSCLKIAYSTAVTLSRSIHATHIYL
jgi:hypothetical protein